MPGELGAKKFREKNLKNELIELSLLVFYTIFVAVFLPALFGLGFGGFLKVEYLQKFNFYPMFLFGGLIGLIFLKVAEILTQGKVDAVIHDPEQGLIDAKIFKNPISMYLLSFAFFSFLGMFFAFKNTFWVGVPQAILPTGFSNKLVEIIFTVEPPATAETLIFVFLISVFLSLVLLVLRKRNMEITRTSYFIISVVIAITTGILWMGFHELAYGGQEVALWSTFVFGTFGSFLTLLFNSLIPWLVWHETTNLYIALNSMFSDMTIMFITLFINVLIIVPFFIIWFGRKKKNEE